MVAIFIEYCKNQLGQIELCAEFALLNDNKYYVNYNEAQEKGRLVLNPPFQFCAFQASLPILLQKPAHLKHQVVLTRSCVDVA